ncbi:Hexokinase-3 [Plecturocebus cupreus]
MDSIGSEGLQQGEEALSCPEEGLPRPSDSSELAQECLQQFKVTVAQLQQIQASLLGSMEQALRGQASPVPAVRMLPTYVGSTPHGTEQGDFVVLELGATGASLRVLWVTLTGIEGHRVEPRSQEFVIPQDVMLGAGQQLFDFAAHCLSEFLDAQPVSKQDLQLGFSFSFPCHQTGLDRSTLISWTKGFRCSDVEGQDVVQLLRDAIQRQGAYNIDVVAVVNDTVGTMMGCELGARPCEVGLVVDTGTNVCYMEEARHVAVLDEDRGRVCVSVEWGSFSDDGALGPVLTTFDHTLDHESLNPGAQRFEKMIGGLYLGELVRLVLAHLTQRGVLFRGCLSPALLSQGSILLEHVAEMEDPSAGAARVHAILQDLGLSPEPSDVELVQRVCAAVCTRAAQLCAAALAAVLFRLQQSREQQTLQVAVATGGRVCERHPRYCGNMVRMSRWHEHAPGAPGQAGCTCAYLGVRAKPGSPVRIWGSGPSRDRLCVSGGLGQAGIACVYLGVRAKPGSSVCICSFCSILQGTVMLLAPECDVSFIPSADGGGRGVAMVTAVAARLAAHRRLLEETLAPFRLNHDQLAAVQAQMREAMAKGLQGGASSLRMLPTYVRATPDGSERGDFLALDLGGTNFRVLLVRVTTCVQITSQIYSIPESVAQGSGQQLFDHIVDCIVDFQQKQGLSGQSLPLGFTFSFPCRQLGLDQGILLNWTKGFNASDCEGQDVVSLLREAITRRQAVELNVVAIVNDTVGTMMSCGYEDPHCEIGLIVGTGTNACYMEELRNVAGVPGDSGHMCINMEWGAFGDDGSLDTLSTCFDASVDQASINPGKQRFEKMISGMYLGEIVRHILLHLTSLGVLFRGQQTQRLQTRDIFKTKFLSEIESDSLALRQVRAILEDLGLPLTSDDALMVLEVCQAVSQRAAQLCGAGVAAVVEKIRENRGLEELAVSVGVDGTLYKLHPHFSSLVAATVRELAPRCAVTFLQSEDGSGKGAALVTAVACRLAQSTRV